MCKKSPSDFLILLKQHPCFHHFKRKTTKNLPHSFTQLTIDTLTKEMSSELSIRIHQETAGVEFSLWQANAFCALPIFFEDILGPTTRNYDGFIIVVHTGLFNLCHNIFKLILTRFTGPDRARINQPSLTQMVLPKEDIYSSIYHVLEFEIEQTVTNYKAAALPLKIEFNDGRNFLLSKLEGYAYMFIVAHELGHALLGHLKSNSNIRVQTYRKTLMPSHLNSTQQNELDADNFAFATMMNCIYVTSNDTEIGIAIAAAEAALFILALREKAGRFTTSVTHPPAQYRLQILRENWLFPDQYYSLTDDVNRFMRRALEKMDDYRSHIRKKYEC